MVEQLKNKCTSFLICDVRNDRWSVAYSIVDSAHTGSQFNFLSTIQWKLSQTNNMRLERVSFTIFAVYGHLHVANTVISTLLGDNHRAPPSIGMEANIPLKAWSHDSFILVGKEEFVIRGIGNYKYYLPWHFHKYHLSMQRTNLLSEIKCHTFMLSLYCRIANLVKLMAS